MTSIDMQRKEVDVQLESIGYDMDNMSFDDAIAFLQKRRDSYAQNNHFKRYVLKWTDRAYEDGQNLFVYGVRDENDEELAKRQEMEASIERMQRYQYEQLKAKFEGNTDSREQK